jgi:hypothetical protein
LSQACLVNGFLKLKRSSEIQLCVSNPDNCSYLFPLKTIQQMIKLNSSQVK